MAAVHRRRTLAPHPPNALGSFIVQATFAISAAVLFEAS